MTALFTLGLVSVWSATRLQPGRDRVHGRAWLRGQTVLKQSLAGQLFWHGLDLKTVHPDYNIK
jgi:hypothetical protein